MTIYDIARQVGVSASTVSRVINKRPGINAKTREKVEKALRESNFSINEAAKGLVNQSSRMIGILVSDIRNQHHIEGAYMIEQYFLEKGYCSLLFNAGTDKEGMAGYIKLLSSRRVDALVLIGSIFQNDEVMLAIENYMPNVPVVMQNGILDLPNVSSVVSNDGQGAYDAVVHMYNKGKMNIAFINNNDTPSNLKKLAGYRRACGELGMKSREILRCEDSFSGGAAATEELVRMYPDVDAILYSVDTLAAGGVRFLVDMGLSIPDDIALFGTDNSPFALITNPRLSSVDTKLRDLSNACADILSRAIEDRSYRKNIQIDCSLVLRETT